jgi:hypothetical protein
MLPFGGMMIERIIESDEEFHELAAMILRALRRRRAMPEPRYPLLMDDSPWRCLDWITRDEDVLIF